MIGLAHAVAMLLVFLPQQDKTAIPTELLDLSYQQCYQPCRDGFRHQVCEALCSCSVEKMRDGLDFDRYLQLLESMSKDSLSTEDRSFLDSVAGQCSQELDRRGISIEEPVARPLEGEDIPPPPSH